jgi:uncharacterized protein YdhG (YjbR/CyaY superfamily)
MNSKPTTIDEYIQAAPTEGQAHLNRLYAILQELAPEAQQVIKWGVPFFIEPRFLFAFSAHKKHLNFTPNEAALTHFHEQLAGQMTTKGSLQVFYHQALPEALIRDIAVYRLRVLSESDSDSFW